MYYTAPLSTIIMMHYYYVWVDQLSSAKKTQMQKSLGLKVNMPEDEIF